MTRRKQLALHYFLPLLHSGKAVSIGFDAHQSANVLEMMLLWTRGEGNLKRRIQSITFSHTVQIQ